MGFIMNQVNYPDKLVWAHLKLDTNNNADILPYLHRSINIDDSIEEIVSEEMKEKPSEL
jgi:hypothetical protein